MPEKQHRFRAWPSQIRRDRRKTRLEIVAQRPDLRMLVHGPTVPGAIDPVLTPGHFFLTGAGMSNGRSFVCCEGVRA